jgi:hypothetical protein
MIVILHSFLLAIIAGFFGAVADRNEFVAIYEYGGNIMKWMGIFLSVLVMVIGLALSANAALVDMDDGTIYDTDTQLSWLKNANMAGYMTWDQAVAWAASLNNNGGFAGLTGWRLPATAEPDASCGLHISSGGRFPFQGYGYSCTNSEMGHLYYVALGNAAGGPWTNTGPFTNLQATSYWSGTEYAPDTTAAWTFYFYVGYQGYGYKYRNLFAWAVCLGVRSQ